MNEQLRVLKFLLIGSHTKRENFSFYYSYRGCYSYTGTTTAKGAAKATQGLLQLHRDYYSYTGTTTATQGLLQLHRGYYSYIQGLLHIQGVLFLHTGAATSTYRGYYNIHSKKGFFFCILFRMLPKYCNKNYST